MNNSATGYGSVGLTVDITGLFWKTFSIPVGEKQIRKKKKKNEQGSIQKSLDLLVHSYDSHKSHDLYRSVDVPALLFWMPVVLRI